MARKQQHFFSHKVFYTLLALIMFAGVSYIVYSYVNPIPNPGHGADTVWIAVNGQEKTLQQAVDAGDFGSLVTGSSSTFSCSPAVPSTGYCNMSSGFLVMGPGVCCGVVDASLVTTHKVFIGADNNGQAQPDCWSVNQGTGYFSNKSCGYKQWDVGSASVAQCVVELRNVYNNIVNPDGEKGGWFIQGYRDTGQASPCIDGSSDLVAVNLVRYSAP